MACSPLDTSFTAPKLHVLLTVTVSLTARDKQVPREKVQLITT
jgi:hypothetical protein